MKKLIIMITILLLTSCTPKYIEGPIVLPSEIEIENIEYVDEYEEYLDRYLDSFINDKTELIPHYNGFDITWVLESGNAKVENNTIYKTETSKEYEEISLRAYLGETSYVFENIELIDPYVGYLMTYFVGDGLKNEKVYYAWTFDGLLWYQINFQEPVLSASIGTRRLRDPSVIRKKNGEFTLIATEGFDNPDIFAFDTENLVEFNDERLIKLNSTSDNMVMSETQAWAPEGFYDRRINKYIIYWSSPNDEKMFYSFSNNLDDISYPEILVDVGFPVIDGTIMKVGSDYSIVLKDERKPMEKHSQLFVGYSDTDYKGFNHFNFNFFSNHQSEGPFIIKSGYEYILYYDDYTRHQFKAFKFYELKSNKFEEIDDKDIKSSIKNLKHGSAIALTWKEFERIKEHYDTGEN
ncbi:MAG: glycoside hydrolase family 43 protein [Erysipelotrichaceae bacterium]|nr:glycoside hydrolase family 43 protein [Erysipelotrichaceae bacterium]